MLRLLCLALLCLTLCAQAAGPDADLLDAARQGDLEKVKSLLAAGANIDAKNKYGITPLFYAAWSGHAAIVQLLIEKGANIEIVDTFYRMPALGAAINKNNDAAACALIKAGHSKSAEMLTPAARGGRMVVVETILAHAKPTQKQLDEALEVAIIARKEDVAAVLKKFGAQPPKAVQIPLETLQLYAGKYRGEPMGEVEVALKNGALVVNTNGQSMDLLARDDKTFALSAGRGVTLQFTVVEGKAASMTVTQGGQSFTLKRAEAGQ
jgi:uncharacterized protein